MSDRLGIDDFDVEEEVRPDFPCPYCYEDFDIASLCSHLEDEHSCESRVTVRGFFVSLMLFYDVCFVRKNGNLDLCFFAFVNLVSLIAKLWED